MPIGIVALSYAKRAEEPNPVNVKLAQITDELDDFVQQTGESTVLVSQWEIARALPTQSSLIVTQDAATNLDRNGKLYLDSKDVLNKAFYVFRAYGITDVIVVANPFLHLQAAKSIVRKAGFDVMSYKVPSVGFDNSPLNLQWWCKGPIRFVIYLGIQVLGKLTKQNLHGIGEKPHPH
ncbi:MAG: hypothetical protein JWO54_308 [Candidatus Saccharibacteria bacterium]|nr:hypothetical protein [Candidatus Saccharibacteria bacterium]